MHVPITTAGSPSRWQPNGLLGDYLRARRRAAQDDSGRAQSRRGLRREDVARLAGVSTPYYARLERGENRHPSSQVTDALAAALRMTPTQRAHLRRLAGLHAPARPLDPVEERREFTLLLHTFRDHPWMLLTPAREVVELSVPLGRLLPTVRPGVNLVGWLFLDPTARRLLVDWAAVSRREVASMQLDLGGEAEHTAVQRWGRDLAARSREFAQAWNAHDLCEETTAHLGVRAAHGGVHNFQQQTLHVHRSRWSLRVHTPSVPTAGPTWAG